MKPRKGHIASFFDLQSVTSGISTTLVLLLLGMVVFFVLAAGNLSVYVRERINFSVILSDDTKERDIPRILKELNAQPFIRSTQYVSKEQALKEQTEAMGTDPADFLGYNPFGASIEVKLKSEYTNTDSIARIEEWIRERANVREVVYQKELIDAVNDNIRSISLLLLGLAAILTFVSSVLINNTIRLTIYSQRFLIHTMKLVGASRGFIRKPFLRRNFWMGLLSAALADVVLWTAANWLVGREPELTEVVTPVVMTQVSVAVLLFGIVITGLCALFSINKYLRMKADVMYHI